MQIPTLPLEGGALYVDNSMLELLQTCPRALLYNRFYKRVAAADKPSLNFGSAIHIALEHRYRKYGSNAPDYDCEEEQAALLQKHFADHPQPLDDFRTLNWAIEVMRQYNLRYQVEPFNLLTAKNEIKGPDGTVLVRPGEPLVELPFALPLFTWSGILPTAEGPVPMSIPIIYCGKIDLPTMHDRAVLVTDHKTSSMLGAQFFERAAMLAQLRGYAWAFAELTGIKVHGYTVNAIRTKQPPVRGADAKWWSESFGRQNFYLDEDAIDEWRRNAIALVEEMFWHVSRGYMPMKTSWCCVFGKCQYYDVCTLPRDNREVMLSSGVYTENTWTPLKSPSAPQV